MTHSLPLARMAPLHASGFVSDKEFEGYQTAAEARETLV